MKRLVAPLAALAALGALGCAPAPAAAPPPLGAPSPRLGPGGVNRLVLAVSPAGQALAAASVVDGAHVRVTTFEEQPGGWQERPLAAALDGGTDSPTVAISPSAAVLAVRAIGAGGNDGQVFAWRRDAAGAWRGPEGPLSAPPRAYEPSATFGSDGEVLLAMNQWVEPNYGVRVVTAPDATAPFVVPATADAVLSPRVFFSNGPKVSPGPGGRAAITWYQSLGGPLRVLLSERPGPGEPFAPTQPSVALSPDTSEVASAPYGNPVSAWGADGALWVAWTQEDHAGGAAVLLAQRPAGGDWRLPASDEDSLSVGRGLCRDARLGVRRDGTALVAWSQRAGPGVPERVYLAMRKPGGATTLWQLSDDGADADSPTLAVDGDDFLVAFVERPPGGPAQLALRRGDGDAPGPLERVPTAGTAALPVAGAGAGRFVVAFTEAGFFRALAAAGP